MGERGEPIRTNGRIVLRRAVAEDRDAFVALRRTSGRFLTQWEPIPTLSSPDVDPNEQLFQRYIANNDERRVPMLITRCDDGEILGSININEISHGSFLNCALGWWIGSPHAGQGYMREALHAALEHVFLDLELHRVEANIQPHNAPSLALVRHAGFRLEGLSERYLKIDGEWVDHERWAMTAEEWLNSR